MKRLLVAAALAPLTFAAAKASAQTISGGNATVSSPVYAPIVSNGNNVIVNSGESVTPLTGGVSTGNSVGGTAAAPVAAITLNSNNTVSNAGTISYNAGASGVANNVSYLNDNYATGILVKGAGSLLGSVANAGTISLIETTDYTDTNSDGIVDANNGVKGQFDVGTNRFGIQTEGAGLFLGGIGNAGTITVIGENSAGIQIGAGGITGLLSNAGTIAVTGGNAGTSNVSFGINALGPVGSFLNDGGSISALGQNAVGVNLAGGANGITVNGVTSSGSVEIYGSITATGYRSTTAPTIPSVLSLLQAQAAYELLQGGPALAIGGSVSGGISLDAATTSTGSTAALAGAAITAYGRAPALLIGSGAAPMTISAFGTSGYGLVIGGSVTGSGVYDLDSNGAPVGANGVQIGVGYINSSTGLLTTSGSQAVSIVGGLDLLGTVTASGISRTADSSGFGGAVTALHIGNAAITGAQSTTTNNVTYGSALNIVGTVSAASVSTVPVQVTAIQIDAGASIPSLYNRGDILAGIGGIAAVLNTPASGGTAGDAVAIVDKSGSLASITNSGTIQATITPIDPTQTVTATSKTTAIDLSANTTGATILQVADPALLGTTSAGVTTIVEPTITGDVLFGSGNGKLDLEAGTLTGGMSFGSGVGNAITVNSATATGALSEAGGGQLAINVGTASGATASLLKITQPVTSSLGGDQATIGISSLHVGSAGELILSVGATSASNTAAQNNQITAAQLNASGAVTFDSGAQLGLNFTSKLTQTTTYTLITANAGAVSLGSIVSGAGALSGLGNIPYLYNASVGTDANHDDVTVTVSQKTTQQLGLNRAEASAYDAIYGVFDKEDSSASNSALGEAAPALLSADNRSDFIKLYDQYLPDYSGGPFEDTVLAQQAIARAEADSPEKLETDATRGWVQEITYYNSRSDSDQVNGYTSKGFGFAGGTEKAYGHSAVGLAGSFISSSIHDLSRPDGSSQGAAAVEVGAYWRTSLDGLNMGASVNGGWSFLESRRTLLEQSGSDAATLYRLAKANWDGGVASASFNISYKENFGRYYIKPEAVADYVMMYEGGYTEHGGGDAFDLTIGSKFNKEAVVQTDLVMGATYGTATHWSPELTVGWRQIVYGGPADTTASFAGGAPFKLSPDYQDQGGVMARIGLRASGNFADFNASAGGVFRTGYQTFDARAAARFLF
jgi:hypothetical protein